MKHSMILIVGLSYVLLWILRQTGDLHEYYDNFYQAMHRVLVHNDKYDDVFFVMWFIDGLKAELRSAI